MRKIISLLSGGLDSPVAALLMMQRNFQVVFLSFLTSDDSRNTMKNKIIQIFKQLKSVSKSDIKAYIIVHDPTLNQLIKYCDRKLTCILCKRMMLRTAIEIGKIEKTNLIVTGDILGEQASQTLDNLVSYNNILDGFIVIRPLIGWDKMEVINLSKKFGLYNISSQSSASCEFNPKYPETHAKFNDIYVEEKNLNTSEILKETLNRAEILYF